uniref:DNA 5'-3' helicase n=2 Tax=Gracilariopsis TaxID=2781 RepID=A0A1C9CF79_9FLOR|nr:DNA replication helicase [Gracilariopsis lemaneiformis]YP_009294759.1 replication helicase subunit [Gracilariopsis chorda]AJO68400.1 replication helicase subunit [Gracilariopsis lemaneiformis]AML79800.1 DNA replication helicase [Gracilariopsis lemaneiformis]AOM67019.1 replication helicase subunit [Gracilariopsis chorda]
MQNINLDLFLPQNYIAEEILLGTILINPMIFPQIIPYLKQESFFLECHELIYKSLIIIYRDGKIDILHLLYTLNRSEKLDHIGGVYKIMELMRQGHLFMSSINMSVYVQQLIILINNSYMKRLMIQYGYNIVRLASIESFKSHHLYNTASDYLESTVHKIPKENLSTFRDILGDLLIEFKNHYSDLEQDFVPRSEILSGFHEIDELMKGLQDGDLIVVAGRPSIGKTSFVINIAYNILSSANLGLCFFSLEMSKIQIVYKFIAVACKISLQSFSLNQLTVDQQHNFKSICNSLMNSNIYINDSPNMSVDYIEYTSKLLFKETRNIQLIIIDYLQLIQVENFTNNVRAQELAYITRKLKLLAQYLYIPIIVLSQLNRSIETRLNKNPLLSDLRESGCLISYLLLNIDLYNSLHSHSLYKNQTSIKYSLIKLFYNDYLSQLSSYCINWKFILQYSFNINIYNYVLSLTHNHKLYNKLCWTKNNQLLEEDCAIMNTFLFYSNIYLEYKLIRYIKCLKYVQVFDIQEPNYLSLLCNYIILHNSIEQDADIVMILSQSNDHLDLFKTVDITLCKNRNGPTGVCKLLFTPEKNLFSNI